MAHHQPRDATLLDFTAAPGHAAILPPPRRILTRRRGGGMGLARVLLFLLSTAGTLAALGMLVNGHPLEAAETFAATTLLLLVLLLAV